MNKRMVLITGGTRGIGEATARAFKEKGYLVAANYAFNDSAAEIFHEDTGIAVYKWDVANAAACIEGVKKVVADFGPVDILVNNAGITRDRTLKKMTLEEWEAVINADLGGCFHMSRAVIAGMEERKFGRIVNMSSVCGTCGNFGQTNYSAAKAGVIGFTKALALETATKGITVNAIAPGFIETSMLNTIPDMAMKELLARIPMKRLGKPEDIARAILFLTADETDYITGETLAINGGMNMA